MLQGITDQFRKQAEQRMSSRFIMNVPGICGSAEKNTQKGRRYGKSEQSQKLKKSKRLPGFRAQAQLSNDLGALLH